MATSKQVISMTYDNMFELVSTAQSTILLGNSVDDLSLDSDKSYAMLYQSNSDKVDKRISLFAYDSTALCAVHESLCLNNVQIDASMSNAEIGVLPLNKTTNDRRAFLRADNLVSIAKWLKSCPKACNVHMSFEDEHGVAKIVLTCIPTGRSSKTVSKLELLHVDKGKWLPQFRRPFNHGRTANMNMEHMSALHEFTGIYMYARAAKLIGELFGNLYISITPFNNGCMCYVRNARSQKRALELVFSSSTRVNSDDDTNTNTKEEM